MLILSAADLMADTPVLSSNTQAVTYCLRSGRNNGGNGNYCIVPSGTQGTYGEQLHTYDDNRRGNDYWYYDDAGDGYYYIIFRDGRYMYHDASMGTDAGCIQLTYTRRTRFSITVVNDWLFNIVPEGQAEDRSLNAFGGEGGTIGLYNPGDGGSKWRNDIRNDGNNVIARCTMPTLASVSGNVATFNYPQGATLYYSFGDLLPDPNSSSSTTNGQITLPSGTTHVNVIAVRNGYITSQVYSGDITVGVAGAGDYVIQSGENYLAHSGTGFSNTTTFDPNTCIWTFTNDGNLCFVNENNQTVYLSINSANDGLVTTTDINAASVWERSTHNDYPVPRFRYTIGPGSFRFITYNNGWTALGNRGNGSPIYPVTHHEGQASETAVGNVSLTVTPTSREMDLGDQQQFTASFSASSTTTYHPEYWTFNDLNHYYEDGTMTTGSAAATPQYTRTSTVTSPDSYAWTVGCSGNVSLSSATGNSTTATYTTYANRQQNCTLTVTATYHGNNYQANATLTLAPNPDHTPEYFVIKTWNNDGHYLCASGNTTVGDCPRSGNSTEFDYACIWERVEGKYRNVSTGKYLKATTPNNNNNGTFSLVDNINDASAFLVDSELSLGLRAQDNRMFYIKYRDNSWIFNYATENNNWYRGSLSELATTETASLSMTNIQGAGIISATGDFTYTCTANETISTQFSYTQTGNNNPGTFTCTQASAPIPVSVVWSLENDGGYATVDATTGVVTVSSRPDNNHVMTLVATATADGETATRSFRITLRGTNLPPIPEELQDMIDNPNNPNYTVTLTDDIDASGLESSIANYTGTFDGGYKKIAGLTVPLFDNLNGTTVRNVILDEVNIAEDNANVGALARTASGNTRIYNCGVLSGSVGATTQYSSNSTTAVGSIVGHIWGNARVINCYSFANITGGMYCAGIVGWNNGVAPQYVNANITTMIMNCIFYGDITGGTNKYPVYGGNHIQNTTAPIYDYFLLDGISYRDDIGDRARSALPVEARFLTRFEYMRATLNSNRRLAAWYISGNNNDTALVGKWVLDKSMAPYPIIKPWGRYPSLVNPDWASKGTMTDPNDPEQRYRGKTMGTLTVTIQSGGHSNRDDKTITLPITDMDTANYDFNYYKVQLPYYNDHYTDNYQAPGWGQNTGWVVTGWDIISVTGGTTGTFSTSGDNAYNFADRNCTQKDLCSVSGRVFAQGGFYNVPEDVTAITIKAHWGKAVYVTDPYIDKVYHIEDKHYNNNQCAQRYIADNFTLAGSYPGGNYNAVNSLQDAFNRLDVTNDVYSQALVLIGNLHHYNHNIGSQSDWNTIVAGNTNKAYTIMSIDADRDNEPDFIERYGHCDGEYIAPMRIDFTSQVGLSWIKKPHNTDLLSYSGIAMNLGHFEITETGFARFTEYEALGNQSSTTPLIFNGGLIEQFVTTRERNDDQDAGLIPYCILGGHTYFWAYTPGCHATNTRVTRFFPVSVLGGEYEEFYLTGRNANVNSPVVKGRIYTNGGKIGTYCSGYWERLNGDAIIKMDHIIIDTFFGGSLNPAQPIMGDINITINNSLVDFFCGGPKAGNMAENKNVTTIANNTQFGTFVGAGFGGSSVARYEMKQDVDDTLFSVRKATYMNKYFRSQNTDANKYKGYTDDRGILIRYAIEYMPGSGGFSWGCHTVHVLRWHNEYAQLSLANCNNVTSTLNNCTVLGDFYGGAYLGSVGTNGNDKTVTSTLNNCIVGGSVYGGGKEAAIPSIAVFPESQDSLVTPLYHEQLGLYYQQGCDRFPTYPSGTQYSWSANGSIQQPVNDNARTLWTTVDLNNLGTVFGQTILTVNGGHVYGSVFGGGNAAKVTGNTTVTVKGPAVIDNNVYGGGNQAEVGGNTHVIIGE